MVTLLIWVLGQLSNEGKGLHSRWNIFCGTASINLWELRTAIEIILDLNLTRLKNDLIREIKFQH